MKRLALLALAVVASANLSLAQSPPPVPSPSATPKAGAAPEMSDNEALRRILYWIWNPATPVPPVGTASSPSVFTNYGANATLNVKATTGNVFSMSCSNANAADRFVQLHNTATTPAGGATPTFVFRVPAAGQIVIGTDFFTNAGVNFSTGIAFAFSTTQNTYTAATAADQTTMITYK